VVVFQEFKGSDGVHAGFRVQILLVSGSFAEVVEALVEDILKLADGASLGSDLVLSIVPKSPADILIDEGGARAAAPVCLSVEVLECLLGDVALHDFSAAARIGLLRRLVHTGSLTYTYASRYLLFFQRFYSPESSDREFRETL